MASATKKTAHKLLDEIAYARLTSEYEKAMSKMQEFQPLLHQWVLEIDRSTMHCLVNHDVIG